MATQNSTLLFPVDPQPGLDRFTNYLYARRGMAPSTIGLLTGYIRRMLPLEGEIPTADSLDQLVGDMRRRGVSYGTLTNAMRSLECYMEFLGAPIRFGRPRKPKPT